MNKKFIFNLSILDQIGIIAKVSSILSNNSANILESSQYGDANTHRFFMRCLFEINENLIDDLHKSFKMDFQNNYSIVPDSYTPKTVVMATKDGTCLNHLLYRSQQGVLPIDISSIVSNHLHLKPLAEIFNIPFHYFPINDDKSTQEVLVYNHFIEQKADLLVLARYMQVLSPDLTKKLAGKAINIHHSFLPSFKGSRPYYQAYNRGVKLIGATAHYVTDELDEGPIIEQEVIRVDHSLNAKQLATLGSEIESQVLAKAVKYHAEKRVFLNGIKTVVFK